MFNARSETVAEKRAFAEAFARRRCLVPVDGFYEWRKRGQQRDPFYFSAADGHLLALAGLWERWEYPGGQVIESCSVLTCPASALMRPIHHRMPVILPATAHDRWLDPGTAEPGELQALLRPAPEKVLQRWPVGREVGRSSAEGPQLIAPVHDDPPAQFNLF
jgi:putative SOS response-associated peptidase YedK